MTVVHQPAKATRSLGRLCASSKLLVFVYGGTLGRMGTWKQGMEDIYGGNHD